MKKTIASIMALLMMCSSQTSALNKESTVKKVVYNVCTKVLPVAAVTLGAGFLVKKFVINRENNVPDQQRLASGNDNKINTNCGKSNKEKKVCSRPTFNTNNVSVSAQLKSVNTDKKDKFPNNVALTEQQAYDDGIRYIKWHSAMCWFNASILYLYYNNFYRDFLCDMKETTYNEGDSTQKKIIIALANLVKKIKNSKTCMCELSKQEYESVLSLYREYDSNNKTDYEFGKSKNQMVVSFISLIDAYSRNNKGGEVKNSNDGDIRVVFTGNNNGGHYYNLYYSKKTNRLYSIGESVMSSALNVSVYVVKPESKLYKLFDERNIFQVMYDLI